MNAQLNYAFAHRFRIAEIAGFDLSQSGSDSGFRHFVTKRGDPLYERVSSIFLLVIDEFDHGISVA
jgi:hypothetical protein